MKKNGLLNPDLSRAIAELGHGESLVVADAGLPIPKSCERIDLSVVPGLPHFTEVVAAILPELDVERVIVACEVSDENPAVLDSLRRLLEGLPVEFVSHEEFKRLTADARTVVRTGETTPYANVILVGGVSSVFGK